MFIKSIVLDGFKSYGQRTEIHGFDPEFNAITGLNGSGKSNILDAICFLLGITNLTHVRATNLQELVYKNGQAGVTKATVTIVFDNRDKSQSPPQFKDCDELSITRQVVIGGRNKYLLNGSNIQNNKITDFFRSVQLNVNNPHFLIMQGRITKVLNMKPPEILAMIEEAAGTMLYESKKQNAEKTIEKKDSKLREINGILDEEITPTLNKLKEERTTYLEFQKIQREYEHLSKLYIAHKFVEAEERADEAKNGLEGVHEELNDLKVQIKSGENEMKAIGQRIEDLQRLRDEELGGRLHDMEADQKVKEKAAVSIGTQLTSTKDSIKQEERKMSQTVKGMNSDEKVFKEKKELFSRLADTYAELRELNEKSKQEWENAKKRMEAISVGKFASEDGKSETLQGQIIKLKQDISNAQTTLKTNDLKLKHNLKEIKKLEDEMKKSSSAFKRDSDNLKKYQDQVDATTRELTEMKYTENTWEELEERRRNLRHEVQAKGRSLDQMSSRMPYLNFQYSDPERNFDRSQVRGVAATLLKVKDKRFFQALDTAGGGKLFNVIVNSSTVSSKLLKFGKLARRTTFLPLDKMMSRPVTDYELSNAHKIVGKNNVWRALDLIDYEPDLRPAMEFIFGSVLICTDLDAANKLAYNKSVGKLCVTLEGDKVNPSGELSGGAAPSGGSKLSQIDSINAERSSYEEIRKHLENLDAQLKEISPIGKKYNHLKEQLEDRKNELNAVKERLSHTQHQRTADDVDKLKTENERLENEMEEAKITEAEGTKKVKDTEYKIKNAKQIKEKELKDAELDIKKCKKAMDDAKKKYNEKESEETALKGEIADLEKSIEEARATIKACEEAMAGYDKEVERLEAELAVANEEVDMAKSAVKTQKEKVAKNNKEINHEQSKIDKIQKLNTERELKVQELTHKISKATTDVKESAERVKQMLEEHEWIQVDRKFFGEAGSAYDFQATDPTEAGKRLKKIKESMKKLEETVNMRAMTMLDKAELSYADLMRKKATVENDKAKIKKVIENLDIKKKEELRKAYQKVNLDFGSIFQSLLPGTEAKLQPPEGQDVLDGLEVKIAFGGIWKDSLSELSGGQRSLVALSLILSLLRYKPAPLYILDEVDAALDLSHTQNIGNMLKKHFQNSQFIVVSLKDGMFNNANVLFKTKFVDGMSTVSRTTQKK